MTGGGVELPRPAPVERRPRGYSGHATTGSRDAPGVISRTAMTAMDDVTFLFGGWPAVLRVVFITGRAS